MCLLRFELNPAPSQGEMRPLHYRHNDTYKPSRMDSNHQLLGNNQTIYHLSTRGWRDWTVMLRRLLRDKQSWCYFTTAPWCPQNVMLVRLRCFKPTFCYWTTEAYPAGINKVWNYFLTAGGLCRSRTYEWTSQTVLQTALAPYETNNPWTALISQRHCLTFSK